MIEERVRARVARFLLVLGVLFGMAGAAAAAARCRRRRWRSWCPRGSCGRRFSPTIPRWARATRPAGRAASRAISRACSPTAWACRSSRSSTTRRRVTRRASGRSAGTSRSPGGTSPGRVDYGPTILLVEHALLLGPGKTLPAISPTSIAITCGSASPPAAWRRNSWRSGSRRLSSSACSSAPMRPAPLAQERRGSVRGQRPVPHQGRGRGPGHADHRAVFRAGPGGDRGGSRPHVGAGLSRRLRQRGQGQRLHPAIDRRPSSPASPSARPEQTKFEPPRHRGTKKDSIALVSLCLGGSIVLLAWQSITAARFPRIAWVARPH